MGIRRLFQWVMALALVGCAAPARPSHDEATTASSANGRWVVIAPHPDDETLIGSGVLHRAMQAGGDAAVIVMTNGDLDCIHDGIMREGESVAGLGALGIGEDRVFFLGYPDGGLAQLGRTPLPPRRRKINGVCSPGNTTYGAHGYGRRDYHQVHFGSAAPYTRDSAVTDLATLLAELRPTDVIVTHPEDTHPDHAATYTLLRSALDRLPHAPRIHRALVHNGDCWPTGTAPHEPCPAAEIAPDKPTPPLSGRLTGYVPRERLEVPPDCLVRDPSTNPKLRAIGAHGSQTRRTLESYLFAFARSDEAFFPEELVHTEHGWQRAADKRTPITQTLRVEAGDSSYALSMKAPIAVSATLQKPTGTSRIALLEDAAGSYTLAIDPDRKEATLGRTFDTRAPEVIRTWLLPHDLWANGPSERIELAIEPRPEDGSVAEISLRVRDELVGVAVDVRPKLTGVALRFSNVLAASREVSVRAASPSARPAR